DGGRDGVHHEWHARAASCRRAEALGHACAARHERDHEPGDRLARGITTLRAAVDMVVVRSGIAVEAARGFPRTGSGCAAGARGTRSVEGRLARGTDDRTAERWSPAKVRYGRGAGVLRAVGGSRQTAAQEMVRETWLRLRTRRRSSRKSARHQVANCP